MNSVDISISLTCFTSLQYKFSQRIRPIQALYI